MWPPYSPKIPCSCLPTARWGWDLHQILPSRCPGSLPQGMDASSWLWSSGQQGPTGGLPEPVEQWGPLTHSNFWDAPLLGRRGRAASSPPPAPADAVPLAGRRDGAQRHAPLQEEVRHHAALQAHLSWGLTRPPRRTRNATLSAHAGPRDLCGDWPLAPASNPAGTQAPVMSPSLLGPVTLSHPTGVV